MHSMFKVLCGCLAAATLLASPAAAKQLYEVRRYQIDNTHDAAKLDSFLSEAMLPALRRAGSGPIGLLAPAADSESQDRFVIITYDSADQVAATASALASDETYQKQRAALENGGPRKPPYARISSELLVAMDCMPMAKMPSGIGTPDTRVYELRVYESANEGLGDRKVEMFNSGEVPIFLDCGIEPVFLGQALVSKYAPSLTYLTAYPSDEARLAAWDAFLAHPDWKVLSGNPRYRGTVSRIEKFVLRPLPGSDM